MCPLKTKLKTSHSHVVHVSLSRTYCIVRTYRYGTHLKAQLPYVARLDHTSVLRAAHAGAIRVLASSSSTSTTTRLRLRLRQLTTQALELLLHYNIRGVQREGPLKVAVRPYRQALLL